LLPKREARWMKKRLRRLRRAASDARDLDVLAERLGKTAEETGDSRWGALSERLGVCRRKAQKPLARACEKAQRRGFKKRSRALTKAVAWQPDQPEPALLETARTTLAPLVDTFLQAARADLADAEAIHRMRIAGKRVRYALELLAGAFADAERSELLAAFEEIQDKLGAMNDLANAVATFRQWCERAEDDESRAVLAELVARDEQQLEARRQEFRAWWTSERTEALAQRCAAVLGGTAAPAT
jgi:CHAD domain-containing protein